MLNYVYFYESTVRVVYVYKPGGVCIDIRVLYVCVGMSPHEPVSNVLPVRVRKAYTVTQAC